VRVGGGGLLLDWMVHVVDKTKLKYFWLRVRTAVIIPHTILIVNVGQKGCEVARLHPRL
jgi:hypothetical protein